MARGSRNRTWLKKKENFIEPQKRIRGFTYPVHRAIAHYFFRIFQTHPGIDTADNRTVFSLECQSYRPDRRWEGSRGQQSCGARACEYACVTATASHYAGHPTAANTGNGVWSCSAANPLAMN